MRPTPDTGPGPAATPRGETPRIQLARLAADVTSRCPGVAGLDRGPQDRYCTHAGEERLPGVVVIADVDPGRYAVSVYLTAELTDLPVLAAQVRAAVRSAATEQGLGDRVGEIRVAVTDIDYRSPGA